MIGTWNKYPINQNISFGPTNGVGKICNRYVIQEMLNTFHVIISHVDIVF